MAFSANSTPIATNSLVGGSISATTDRLPLGTNATVAQYVGDRSFQAGTGKLAQVMQLFGTCSQTNVPLSMVANSDRTFTLTFAATPQADYYVLVGPDVTVPMTNWKPVAGSLTTGTNLSGLWRFTVTNTAARECYRGTAVTPCQ